MTMIDQETDLSIAERSQTTSHKDWPREAIPRKWVEALFARMTGIYRDRWSGSFPDLNILELSMRDWAMELHDMTGDQIKRGIDRCRSTMKFPPSPADFREAAGVPSSQPMPKLHGDAYLEYKPGKSLPKAPHTEVVNRVHDLQGGIKKGQRRSLFSQHYGPADYERDIAKAREEGTPFYAVDMAAMARNGWTESDEENWRANMLSLGYSNRMYPRGHEPR